MPKLALIRDAASRLRHRRGMSLIVVLGIISVAMAASYATMRAQSSTLTLQQNSNGRQLARQAAMAGLTIGMQKMYVNGWAGVGTTFHGQISTSESYQVRYETGDPELEAGDADFADWPYRVTVISTGISTAGGQPASYTMKAVQRLIPKALSPVPEAWNRARQYALHKHSDRPMELQFPCQINGPTWIQGELELADEYPNFTDHKPFHGAIDEVAVFDRALSASEIFFLNLDGIISLVLNATSALYSSSNPAAWWRFEDASGATVAADSAGARHGSYEGSTFANGISGKAARFGITADHVNLGTIDFSGNAMTILAWFRADSFSTSDARIISKATTSANEDHYWMLSTVSSGGSVRLRFRMRTSGHTDVLIGDTGIPTGQWVFAAAVYDGTSMILYQDGIEVGRLPKTGLIDTNPNVFAFIGANPPGEPLTRYLRDLHKMKFAGTGDYRPLTGYITLDTEDTDALTAAILTDDLGLSGEALTSDDGATSNNPNSLDSITYDELADRAVPDSTVTSYQLFPGGESYPIAAFSTPGAGAQIVASPKDNPLGIYRYGGTLDLDSGVSIEGTLLVTDSGGAGDLDIDGANAQLSAVAMPPLYGTDAPIRLPAAIVQDDFTLRTDASADIDGTVLAADNFEVESGGDSVYCNLQGRVVAREVILGGRTPWDYSPSWWRDRLGDFLLASQNSVNTTTTFPQWLESQYGLAVEPQIKITPGSQHLHWTDWSQPIYAAHPDDGGLRWEMIRWIDGE